MDGNLASGFFVPIVTRKALLEAKPSFMVFCFCFYHGVRYLHLKQKCPHALTVRWKHLTAQYFYSHADGLKEVVEKLMEG